MAMVSLKRTKQEKKDYVKGMAAPVSSSREDYPWGTRLDFDKDMLDKLGIDLTQIKADQEVTFTAKATVCNLSISAGSSGESKSLCLQITDIDLPLPTSKKKSKFESFMDVQKAGPGK